MTNDKKSSLLEQMRKSRGTYEAVFIQFVNNRKYYNSYAFCFYEGEDGKYYDPRIRQKFSDKFMTFIVGNKKEVLVQAPTGSGKTIILLDYIEEYIEENKNTIFVWLTPRKRRFGGAK